VSELGLGPAFGSPDCNGNIECRPSYFQLFHVDSIVAANVGAIIVGSDSSLRHEYVAITAHYDHLGRTRTNRNDPVNAIHPGADDNASGTAAVLELARRLRDRPPRRSVVVLAFGAEELGLVGSRVFAEHAPFDLHRIVLAVNLDMVGRLYHDRVVVFGVDSRYLNAVVDSANIESRFALSVQPRSSGRSDDFSFASHGVPALHLTTGEHPSYHRPSDTADRIEFDGLARVTDFVERIARAVADGPSAR
jgi:Zn-dependent M28 family amino/carboxypeptidase